MPLNSNKKPSRKAKILPQFSFYSGNKPLLDLLEIQRKSFFDLLEYGIKEELSKTNSFRETAKFSGFTQELELAFNPETYKLVSPNLTPREAILKGKTYACKLYVQATLTIRSSPHGSAVETDRKLVFSRMDGEKSFGARKKISTSPYSEKHQGNVSYSVNKPNFPLLQSITSGEKPVQPLQSKVFFPRRGTRGLFNEVKHNKESPLQSKESPLVKAQISSSMTSSLTNSLQFSTVQNSFFKESFFYLPFKFPEKFCNYASKSKLNISNDFIVKVPSNFFDTYSSHFAALGVSRAENSEKELSYRQNTFNFALSQNFLHKQDKVYTLDFYIDIDFAFLKSAVLHSISSRLFKTKNSRNLRDFYSLQFVPSAEKPIQTQISFPTTSVLWSHNDYFLHLKSMISPFPVPDQKSLIVQQEKVVALKNRQHFTLKWQFIWKNFITSNCIHLVTKLGSLNSLSRNCKPSNFKKSESQLLPLNYLTKKKPFSFPFIIGFFPNVINKNAIFSLHSFKETNTRNYNSNSLSNLRNRKLSIFGEISGLKSLQPKVFGFDQLCWSPSCLQPLQPLQPSVAQIVQHEISPINPSGSDYKQDFKGMPSTNAESYLSYLQIELLKESKLISQANAKRPKTTFFGTPLSQSTKYFDQLQESRLVFKRSKKTIHGHFRNIKITRNLVDKTKKKVNVLSNPFFFSTLTVTNKHKNVRGVNEKTETDLSLMNTAFGEISGLKLLQPLQPKVFGLKSLLSLVQPLQSKESPLVKAQIASPSHAPNALMTFGEKSKVQQLLQPNPFDRRSLGLVGFEPPQIASHVQHKIGKNAQPNCKPNQTESFSKANASKIEQVKSAQSKIVNEISVLASHAKQPEIANNKNGNVQIFRPWIFLGELPLMTKRGHFILNGSPRVIVNQIARCAGIYFQEKRRGVGFEQEVRVSADLIPQRGPWLRIQSDWEGRFWARLKREGRVKYATLYEAFQESEKQYNVPLVSLITNSSSSLPKSEVLAFHERKAKEDRQKKALIRLFKNSIRYSLGKQGRLRINQRVHINRPEKVVAVTDRSALLITNTNSIPSRFLQSVVHTPTLHPVTTNENKSFRVLQQIGCQLAIKNNQFGFYTVDKISGCGEICAICTIKDCNDCNDFKPLQPLQPILMTLGQRNQVFASVQPVLGVPSNQVVIDVPPDFNVSHKIIGNKFFRKNRTHDSETLLTAADINAVHTCLERLLEGKGFTDDIDHLKNRLVRTSGKLLQHQLEIGLTKLNEVITPLLGNLIQGQLLSSSEDTKVRAPTKGITSGFGSHQQMSPQKKGLTKVIDNSIDNSNGEHASLFFASQRESPLVKSVQPLQSKLFGLKSKISPDALSQSMQSLQPKVFGLKSLISPSSLQSVQPLQPSVAQIAQHKNANTMVAPKVHQKMHKESPQIPFFSLENETPFRWLRTSKPINNAFREFFGSNPLSQYMDQTNPLAEITHKRRLSSMGPGGIKRETAGMEVRGIHPTHYGRVCPIETPEGKNAGLVNSPTVYGRINKNGFMETPLYQVLESQVQKERWTFFSAQQEEDEESSLATGDIGITRFNVLPQLPIPVQTANNPLAHFQQIERNRVGYKALSPVQTISIATALIPFLEHDDANRALMGSNMQRQAIPLLLSERPIVGTGFESMVIVESGEAVQATKMGYVSHVSANQIIIESKHLTWKAPSSVRFCKLSPSVESVQPVQSCDQLCFCCATITTKGFCICSDAPNDLVTFGQRSKVQQSLISFDAQGCKEDAQLSSDAPACNQSLQPLVAQIVQHKVAQVKAMVVHQRCKNAVGQYQPTLCYTKLLYSLLGLKLLQSGGASITTWLLCTPGIGCADASNDFGSKMHQPLQPVQLVQVAQGIPNFLEFANTACTTYAIDGVKEQQMTIAFTCALMEAGSFKDYTGESNDFSATKQSQVAKISPSYNHYNPSIGTTLYRLQTRLYKMHDQITNKIGCTVVHQVKSVQSVQSKIVTIAMKSPLVKAMISKKMHKESSPVFKKAQISPVNLQLCITQDAFFLKKNLQPLQIYQRSNQETCLSQRPLVSEGEWVFKGDVLADSSASHSGDLALGKNVTVAYMPWEGYNFEDAIVISDRLVADDVYTSIHIERYEIKVSKNSQGKERITNQIPSLPFQRLKHLDNSGIARISSWVQPGDILVGKVVELKRPLSPYERLAWELASRLSPNSPEREKWLSKVWLEDISLRLPPGVCGRIINFQVLSTEWSEKEQLTRPLEVHVYLAVKRKIQVGDKLAGRHGNKGIVSIVLPRQDMPYLADGTSVDMVLNPLGVPSRMNLGQIFECLLGLAGSQLGCNFKVTPFDEIAGGEASRSLVFLKLYQCRLIYKQQWLFTPTFPGKNKLFDGRTGEPFENWVTVGRAYMLKLIHMVDHKIHARSTGPYSLFTRQPVRGRSRRGGQRLGEMEVWAVEGFGAAYTLQEFLTVKSDDLKARAALQRSFYKQNDVTLGKVEISPGNPEAFRVLVSELQALCLHIQM